VFFNYFLPNRNKVTLDELLGLGLGYVFEPESAALPKSNFCPRGITNGPGGQHGLMVSLSAEFCGYHPALVDAGKQVWKQEIDCDYWVGMWTEQDKRPTPETLARENLIEGDSLRLDDGHVWTFPKARHYEEFDGQIIARRVLPARLTRDISGAWSPGEVKERYRELWRLATELTASVVDGTDDWFSEIDNLVIECFKTNYRVNAMELDLLGIHDDQVRRRVPRILLDMDNWETLFKKKQTTLATGSFTAGPPASLPAEGTDTTDQPAMT